MWRETAALDEKRRSGLARMPHGLAARSPKRSRRSREGKALIAAAMADVRAPQSLREAIERDREHAAGGPRAPFWRRHRLGLAAAGTAAAALAVVAITLERAATTRNCRSLGSTRPRDLTQPGPHRGRSGVSRQYSTPRSATWRSRTGRSHSAGRDVP